MIMRDLDGFTVSDLYVALGYGPGAPHRDENDDPRWIEPLALLIDAYNEARDTTMGASVKDIVARAKAAETTPRVVSDKL